MSNLDLNVKEDLIRWIDRRVDVVTESMAILHTKIGVAMCGYSACEAVELTAQANRFRGVIAGLRILATELAALPYDSVPPDVRDRLNAIEEPVAVHRSTIAFFILKDLNQNIWELER